MGDGGWGMGVLSRTVSSGESRDMPVATANGEQQGWTAVAREQIEQVAPTEALDAQVAPIVAVVAWA